MGFKGKPGFRRLLGRKGKSGLEYAVSTHEGRVRENNEDNFWVDGHFREDVEKKELHLGGRAGLSRFAAAICDGMGGESNGETVSLLAVECIRPHTFYELPDAAIADVQAANQRICRYIGEQGGIRSGSTLAALYIDTGRAVSCNVGDSRVYLFRGNRLRLLSKDHNRARYLVDSGQMTEDQARSSSARHTLTQYLGIFEEEMLLEPWFSEPVAVEDGDLFLLCSDGLTDMLLDEEIARILSEGNRPEKQAEALVKAALSGGGRDNITVVVVQVCL